MKTQLYVWAREITRSQPPYVIAVDHTWVTNYSNPGPPGGFAMPSPTPVPPNLADPHYWYCWGTFHAANDQYQDPAAYQSFAGPYRADLEQARCICLANVPTYTAQPEWPYAFLGTIYGVNGVCHQVANRVLWSAGVQANGTRVTVKGVRGWQLSWFMFGAYGYPLQPKKWPLSKCERDAAELVGEHPAVDADLDGMIAELLGPGFDHKKARELKRVRHRMLVEKSKLDAAVAEMHQKDPLTRAVGMAAFAQQADLLLSQALRELSSLLTPREFEVFFGFTYADAMQVKLFHPPQEIEAEAAGADAGA